MPHGAGLVGGVHAISPSSRGGGRCSPGSGFCGCLVIIAFMFVGPALFSRLSAPVLYSPGDTRLVSYDSFFCDSITLRDNSSQTAASIYLITETPPLTDRNNFTIDSTVTLSDGEYYYWNYYLYPNSNFSTEVCIHSPGSDGMFYMVKGRGNSYFSSGVPPFAKAKFSINKVCPVVQRFSYQICDEDEYYFAYYKSSQNGVPLQLTLTLSFERFEYSTSDLASQANCSITSAGECTVTVPYGSKYRALIVTNTSENVDWEENVDVSWSCANRGWAYAVVILLPIATAVVLIVCFIYCCCIHNRRSAYEAIN